jgi:hypothetical protein
MVSDRGGGVGAAELWAEGAAVSVSALRESEGVISIDPAVLADRTGDGVVDLAIRVHNAAGSLPSATVAARWSPGLGVVQSRWLDASTVSSRKPPPEPLPELPESTDPVTVVPQRVRFSGRGWAAHPALSSDGSELAFEVMRPDGNADVYSAIVGFSRALPATVVRGSEDPLSTARIYRNPQFRGSSLIAELSLHDGEFTLVDLDHERFEVAVASGWQRPVGASRLFEGPVTDSSSTRSRTAFSSDVSGSYDVFVLDAGKVSELAATPDSDERFPFMAGPAVVYQLGSGPTARVALRQGEGPERVLGPGVRPVIAGGDVVWFAPSATEWQVVGTDPVTGAAHRVLLDGVALPSAARPALTEDGAWLAVTRPEAPGSVFVVHGGGVTELVTGLGRCDDVVIARSPGRAVVAFTAASSERRRQVYVVNLMELTR